MCLHAPTSFIQSVTANGPFPVCLHHMHPPRLTINRLSQRTHTRTHTRTLCAGQTVQHAKWKSTTRMIWISVRITGQACSWKVCCSHPDWAQEAVGLSSVPTFFIQWCNTVLDFTHLWTQIKVQQSAKITRTHTERGGPFPRVPKGSSQNRGVCREN